MSGAKSKCKQFATRYSEELNRQYIDSCNLILEHLHKHRAQLVKQLDEVDVRIATLRTQAQAAAAGSSTGQEPRASKKGRRK